MAESSINVTEGSGKRLHTYDRTISSVLVQEQAVFPAEYPYASYSVPIASVSIATGSDHIIQLMAGASLNVRVRAIHVEQAGNATSLGFIGVELRRLTTAGSGGTTVTVEKFDPSDSAAGATAQTLPSSKGTEGGLLMRGALALGTSTSRTGAAEEAFDWIQKPGQKPIIIAAGTSNGICLKIITGAAGATCSGWVEFVETAY